MTDLFKKPYAPRLAGSGTRKIKVEQGTEIASKRLIDPLNRPLAVGLDLKKIAMRPRSLDILKNPSRIGKRLIYKDE